MKTTTQIIRKLMYGILLYIGVNLNFVQAQMRVGQPTNSPDPSAALDVSGGPYSTGSQYRGIAPPKVSLVQTASAVPVTNPVTGLLVYNTAKAGDVTPGYYYWEGGKWIRFTTTSNGAGRIAAGGGGYIPAYLLNEVRALTTTTPDNLILVEPGREGLFRLDNADNISADNGGTVLVTAGNKRYKRAFSGPVDVKWFGVKGDSLTDDTANLKLALSNSNTSSTVFFSAGTYRTTSPLTIPNNVQVVFSKAARIAVTSAFAAYTVGGNDAAYVFVMSNNTLLENATININGYATGGIIGLFAHDYTVRGCTVKNWIDNGSGKKGISDLACSNVMVLNNTVLNGVHGIHSYRSNGTIVSGNFIDIMQGGGYYSGWTRRVLVTGNIIKNCGDVGLDFEGGEYNTGMNNTVERCKNGELTIFSGNNIETVVSHHLVLKNNVVHRLATYATARNAAGVESTTACNSAYGACGFLSVDEGAYESGFEGNRLYVENGFGLYHTQLGAGDKNGRNIFFRGNTVTSTAGLISTFDSDGLHITDNSFEGLTGSELVENIIRDAHGLVMTDNRFSYLNTKTTNYAVRLLTVSPYATKAPLFARNSFVNCGTWATQIDLYNNGSLNPIIQANNFGTAYTSNGGLSITANGNANLVDQPLKLLLTGNTTNNVGAVEGLSRSGQTTKAAGLLGYGRAGYNGTSSIIQFMNGTGFYSSPGVQAAGLTISASGGNIILTSSTGNPADNSSAGKLDLIVNSSQ